eukprot:CAMPEP_0175062114 /NCGR_PEP_ID=MMETSP0052_2-20121109/13976_1 /TAXON_ID=51329 ORGANISM="Polytomella parva, Strain SAG 63-3" /NCGR_SAMPLE_ID=MMETSP0052_2 /ASSEMBLY_ACC=CAM_ASM_000194 /LENGTH=377 /DNA_ID=CAMNT_0016328075 /DNA_START=60 /DNA_END=1193 /DNA_ORIENTATION=-
MVTGNMGLNSRFSVNVQGKRCYVFIPWLALICFLSVFIGVIVWAAGASPAFSHSKKAMEDIGLGDEISYFSKFHSVGAAAISICLIFVCVTLGVSLGRAHIERKFEAKSQRYFGTNVWLAVQASLTVIWWAISLWLVFIVMATCLWWGSTLALKSGFEAAISNNQTYSGNVTVGSHSSCPSTCYKPDYFQFVTDVVPCICSNSVLQDAYSHINIAQSKLATAVAGSIIIWIGSSLVVLNMATAFAVTRKELKLARQYQQLGDEANTVGAAAANTGAFSNQFPRDPIPMGGPSAPFRPPMPFPPMPGSIQMPAFPPAPMGGMPPSAGSNNGYPGMMAPGGPRLQVGAPTNGPGPRGPGAAPPMPPPQYQAAVSQPPSS